MRLISQDGMVDMPYEQVVVGLDNYYIEITCWTNTEHHVMAKYSSEIKARKAMEMMRETYLSRMELEGGYDHINQCYVQPNYWVLPKVFQFPKDVEVEV